MDAWPCFRSFTILFRFRSACACPFSVLVSVHSAVRLSPAAWRCSPSTLPLAALLAPGWWLGLPAGVSWLALAPFFGHACPLAFAWLFACLFQLVTALHLVAFSPCRISPCLWPSRCTCTFLTPSPLPLAPYPSYSLPSVHGGVASRSLLFAPWPRSSTSSPRSPRGCCFCGSFLPFLRVLLVRLASA